MKNILTGLIYIRLILVPYVLHCEPPATANSFATVLKQRAKFITSGYLTNGIYVTTNILADNDFKRTLNDLTNGIRGTARYAPWDNTNYFALFDETDLPLALLAYPNFTIPPSVKPYLLIRSNDVLVVGQVFIEYTNRVMHILGQPK